MFCAKIRNSKERAHHLFVVMNLHTVAYQHASMQGSCTLLSLYRDVCVCVYMCSYACERLFLGWVEEYVTEVAVGSVCPVPSYPAGCPGSWIQCAGFGDRCDQVLVLSVPPSPPADLRLAAACYHCTILQVPETNTKRIRSHTRGQKLGNSTNTKHPFTSVSNPYPTDSTGRE